MNKSTRYYPDVRERAVRMVFEVCRGVYMTGEPREEGRRYCLTLNHRSFFYLGTCK